jgi:hypothetical protein
MQSGIHFGESALKAFSKGNTYPVISRFQVYTNGGTQLVSRTNQEL